MTEATVSWSWGETLSPDLSQQLPAQCRPMTNTVYVKFCVSWTWCDWVQLYNQQKLIVLQIKSTLIHQTACLNNIVMSDNYKDKVIII